MNVLSIDANRPASATRKLSYLVLRKVVKNPLEDLDLVLPGCLALQERRLQIGHFDRWTVPAGGRITQLLANCAGPGIRLALPAKSFADTASPSADATTERRPATRRVYLAFRRS